MPVWPRTGTNRGQPRAYVQNDEDPWNSFLLRDDEQKLTERRDPSLSLLLCANTFSVLPFVPFPDCGKLTGWTSLIILALEISNTSTFTLKKEDHTLGAILVNYILKHPDCIFAAYKIPHPMEHVLEIRVQMGPSTTPRKALEYAVEKACDHAKKLQDIVANEFYLHKIVHERSPEPGDKYKEMREMQKERERALERERKAREESFWGQQTENGVPNGMQTPATRITDGATPRHETDDEKDNPWETLAGPSAPAPASDNVSERRADNSSPPPWRTNQASNRGRGRGRPWENPSNSSARPWQNQANNSGRPWNNQHDAPPPPSTDTQSQRTRADSPPPSHFYPGDQSPMPGVDDDDEDDPWARFAAATPPPPSHNRGSSQVRSSPSGGRSGPSRDHSSEPLRSVNNPLNTTSDPRVRQFSREKSPSRADDDDDNSWAATYPSPAERASTQRDNNQQSSRGELSTSNNQAGPSRDASTRNTRTDSFALAPFAARHQSPPPFVEDDEDDPWTTHLAPIAPAPRPDRNQESRHPSVSARPGRFDRYSPDIPDRVNSTQSTEGARGEPSQPAANLNVTSQNLQNLGAIEGTAAPVQNAEPPPGIHPSRMMRFQDGYQSPEPDNRPWSEDIDPVRERHSRRSSAMGTSTNLEPLPFTRFSRVPDGSISPPANRNDTSSTGDNLPANTSLGSRPGAHSNPQDEQRVFRQASGPAAGDNSGQRTQPSENRSLLPGNNDLPPLPDNDDEDLEEGEERQGGINSPLPQPATLGGSRADQEDDDDLWGHDGGFIGGMPSP